MRPADASSPRHGRTQMSCWSRGFLHPSPPLPSSPCLYSQDHFSPCSRKMDSDIPPHIPPQTYITLIHSHLKKRDSPRPADIDQTHQDSLIGPAWVTCSILSQSLGPEGEALSPGGVWLSYPSLRRVSSTEVTGTPKEWWPNRQA